MNGSDIGGGISGRGVPPGAPPQLVVVCQLFHPESVSTGQTLTELVEELSRLGLRITVIACQPTMVAGSPRVPKRIEHAGITILRTWSTRFPKTKAWGKLLNVSTFFLTASWLVIRRYGGTQLLLLTNPPFLPLLGWLVHLLRRQTFGVILFDIMPEQAELLDFIRPGGFVARVWRRFNRLWYRRAAYATVLSRDMLDGALKNSLLAGTPGEPAARAKTHVIHMWSDDRLIRPAPKSSSTEARRLGVLDKFVVQYSGNHGRFHDIATLLAVARSFSPEEGVVFQFIGDGQKKKLVNSGGGSHLYSSGYVAKELLADSLAMADLGVVAQMPGQERVCYPSKLLGVMAAGRATLAICPLDCEMARMIREHELGLVVANGDVEGGRRALLEARHDPERIRRMGENAARHLRDHFTLASATRLYFELIQRHQPKARDDAAGPTGQSSATQ